MTAVEIRQLPDGPAMPASLREQTGKYLALEPGPGQPLLEAGALVEVRHPGMMYLGVVTAAEEQRITIEVEHVLNLAELVIHPAWSSVPKADA